MEKIYNENQKEFTNVIKNKKNSSDINIEL